MQWCQAVETTQIRRSRQTCHYCQRRNSCQKRQSCQAWQKCPSHYIRRMPKSKESPEVGRATTVARSPRAARVVRVPRFVSQGPFPNGRPKLCPKRSPQKLARQQLAHVNDAHLCGACCIYHCLFVYYMLTLGWSFASTPPSVCRFVAHQCFSVQLRCARKPEWFLD